MTQLIRGAAISAMALLLGTACTIVPEALTEDALRTRAAVDQRALDAFQESVDGPISLYEAMARALKYNLDAKLELMEKQLAQRRLDSARFEFLPQLAASYTYDGRDEFSGGISQSLLTGRQSLEPSTSAERDIFTAELALSWNILDFGLSHVRAKQAADEILISEENRRRVANRIAQDVRTAYWRAVSAERLWRQLTALRGEVEDALKASREIQSQQLAAPIEALSYQRNLIAIKRDLQELERELSVAKIQLAALMNLRPNEPYQLVIPDRDVRVQALRMTPAAMEEFALINRPELREVDYQLRINAQETRAAIFDLMPNLNLNLGYNNSSNSFLFSNNWFGYGAQVAWNLLDAFKYRPRVDAVKAQDDVLLTRRLALSMAIMTQVHVSVARYADAQTQYQIAADYQNTQRALTEQVQIAFEERQESEQMLIRERMNALLAEVQFDIAYSDLQNAFASLFSAIGIDPAPPVAEDISVNELARVLEAHWGIL